MPSITYQGGLPTPIRLQSSLSVGKRPNWQSSGGTMATHDKLLPFALAVGMFIGLNPSAVPAAVIYSNGFESGLPVIVDGADGPITNGYCTYSGTNPLSSHTGCVSVVPTSRINAGSGSFVAWADPNQNGGMVEGSTIILHPPDLVDGWHGRYELSFDGSGVRQLVFVLTT